MNKMIQIIIIILIGLPAQAIEVYFSAERMDRLACNIAKSIQEKYPNKAPSEFRSEIKKILRKRINPWVDAYPIPAGFSMPRPLEVLTGLSGFPMDRSEYYLQNAFILFGNPNRDLKEKTENYFSSFIHLARTRHINYLNGNEKKFQLRAEADLYKQIEDHLPIVANYSFPYRDQNGNPIEQNRLDEKEKTNWEHARLAIGNPSHKKFNEFVYESQRYNEFVSPLFVWLLNQNDYSVTPEAIFEKAIEIYDDPIVALGVIPWVFSGDALTVDRGTSSVVSFKMEKLLESQDIPGIQYHFWGYVTQGFIGSKLRVGALSYIYERLYQKDIEDRTADVMALRFGNKIRKAIKNPDICQRFSANY